jgi:hypothetical protein
MPGERLSMSVGWAGEEPLILDAPEGSDDWLDKNPEAGRLILLVEDESVAPVVADAVGAMLALLHGRLGLHCTAVEIPCEWAIHLAPPVTAGKPAPVVSTAAEPACGQRSRATTGAA